MGGKNIGRTTVGTAFASICSNIPRDLPQHVAIPVRVGLFPVGLQVTNARDTFGNTLFIE